MAANPESFWPPEEGGGGGSGGITSSGQVALAQGTTTTTIFFATALSSVDYALVCDIENSTDAMPIFLQWFLSDKTVNGFDITFNAPTDTANYILNFMTTDAAAP